MADYRSKSYNGGEMQIQPYYYNKRPDDFRSYSTSYVSSSSHAPAAPPQKLKSANESSWSFKDPDFQRKKRIISYKVYTVEGKVKGSFKKSFRWFKDKYSNMFYGWWGFGHN